MQSACRDLGRHHVFQAWHFLSYDPAGGFPSPPTAYRRGRRAQNLSRSRTSRAREGLTFTSLSTMAGFERRVEFPGCRDFAVIGCMIDRDAEALW